MRLQIKFSKQISQDLCCKGMIHYGLICSLNQSLDESFGIERIKKVISMSLALCAANLAVQKHKKDLGSLCQAELM